MKVYHIVGYGSLMSHASLREVVPSKHFTPVIVKGYKRVFNIIERNGRDVLNVVPSKNSVFNGVLFSATPKELRRIKEREDWYNFEQTWCYDFLTGKKLVKCLICIDPFVAIDKRSKPDGKYFKMCREAAYHISRQFGEFWDRTTFTSSGKRVSSWMKKFSN